MCERKVYCAGCRFLETYEGTIPTTYSCKNEYNLRSYDKENWLQIERFVKYLATPEEKNKNNDCEWFRKKEIPF